MAVYTGRVHVHVYTTVYTSCTRPYNGRVHLYTVRVQYSVYTACPIKSRILGYVLGRVHGTYTAV